MQDEYIMCHIQCIFLRFQLTNAAVEQLLKLIHILLPKPNQCLKSVYTLKHFFATVFPHVHVTRHKFCTFCRSSIDPSNDYCHGKEYVGEFVTGDLEAQLKEKFKGIKLIPH